MKKKRCRIYLEPAAVAVVQAEMARRPTLAFSPAVNSLLINHGVPAGHSASITRDKFALILQQLTILAAQFHQGVPITLKDLEQLRIHADAGQAALRG